MYLFMARLVPLNTCLQIQDDQKDMDWVGDVPEAHCS